LSPSWLQNFLEAIISQGEVRQLAMAPSQLQQFIQSVRERVDDANGWSKLAVLLTSPQIRRFVRSIVERLRPLTVIMLQNEIHISVRPRTLEQV
jgi:flagellar biosynthesis protein FlhA